MPLFGRRHEVEAKAPEEQVEGFRPTPGDEFYGPHCYSDGFFYPVMNDEHSQEVGPDFSMPLVYKDGLLVHAADDDSSHFHTYHDPSRSPLELEVGAE